MNKFKLWWLIPVFLPASLSYGEIVDRIAAVVNDEIITLSELNGAFEPYRKRIEETYKGQGKESIINDTRMSFLNRLIDTMLINQEAVKNGITVRDEEVMAAIRDILGRKNITVDNFTKELAGQGISFDNYRKEIREQMIKMRLVRREITSKVMVTEGEIGEYYRKHREDYEGKASVRIKQIYLAVAAGADEAARDGRKTDAENLVLRLKNGESFDTLAAKYSQGPTTDGGDLGFIEKGMVLPEVEQAAFALETGQISGVIASRAGFHIIQVVDKRGGGTKPIEAVREEIQMKIEEGKMDKKFEEWLGQLRKKSHIEVKL